MVHAQVNRLKMRRVAVIAHALMPEFPSSKLIGEALQINGRAWPAEGEDPGFIKWLSFPVMAPKDSGGYPVWTDVYVIPVFAPRFQDAVKGDDAFVWTCRVASHAINEAAADGVPLWINWGGQTKHATHNGKRFLFEYRRWLEGMDVYTTHGDVGTVVLAISALQNIGVGDGSRIGVIGADSLMGATLVHAIPPAMSPAEIVLIDEPDEQDQAYKLQRLYELKREAEYSIGDGVTMVSISQDRRHACLAREVDTVVVASPVERLSPEDVPEGAIVVDMTVPPSCSIEDDWSKHRVLHAGCGRFADKDILPDGYTLPDGRALQGDAEPGTETFGGGLIWGCGGEAIGAAMFDYREHECEQQIDLAGIDRVRDWFSRLGLQPQPPVASGRELSWDEVRKANPGNFMGRQL